MKKISCLFLVLLTFLCGCGVNNSNGYDAVDLSYEHICELSNFKCYASYLDQEITIEGEQAKELYKTVSESNIGIEHSPTSSQSNYIYLVFYSSTYNYPSADETTEFYGCYFIYSDGLLQFSGSPYHSAIFSYELKNSIFNDVFEKVFSWLCIKIIVISQIKTVTLIQKEVRFFLFCDIIGIIKVLCRNN